MASYYAFPNAQNQIDLRYINQPCSLQIDFGGPGNTKIAIVHPNDYIDELNEYMQEACSIFPWLPEWGRTYEIEQVALVNYNSGTTVHQLKEQSVIDMKGKNISELMLYIVYARLFWEFDYKTFIELRKKYSLQEALLRSDRWVNGHGITRAFTGTGHALLERVLIFRPELWIPRQDMAICTTHLNPDRDYMSWFFHINRFANLEKIIPDKNLQTKTQAFLYTENTSKDIVIDKVKEWVDASKAA